MKKKNTSLLLLLSFLFAFSALFGITQTVNGETLSQGKKDISKQQQEDFFSSERSKLLQYLDDGTPFPSSYRRHDYNDDYSTVRVLLNFECENTKPTKVTFATMSLCGAYYIDQNLKPIVGSAAQPAVITITANNRNVTVMQNGNVIFTGNTVDIKRVLLGIAGGYANLVTNPSTECSGLDFLGSFRITANENGLRIINHVPTAHYLYGVITHEMHDSWGLEALKSQAIASKAYAFTYPAKADDYDISATQAHQWYYGYKHEQSFPNSMTACLSTIGKILFYNGAVSRAYYGATNGGETNLPSYMFGYADNDNAYSIVRDEYDLQYDYPHMLELPIQYGEPITNAKFKQLIEDEINTALGHSAELITIIHANVNTPAFNDTELNLTKLDLTVRINDYGNTRDLALRFDVNKLDKNHYGVLCPNYTRQYRIFWGSDTQNGYIIKHCRYGNGIGLSQQAARGRCASGQDYKEILQFYFPNMTIANVTESNPELPNAYTKQTIAYGAISKDSVRIRAGASTSDAILDTLPLGTHVNIITEVNDWLVCIANNKLGYIRGDLVNITFFSAPMNADQSIGTASVKPGINDAQLRTGPSDYCAPIFTLNPGMNLEVWHRIGSWYLVRFAGRYVYINASKVTLSSLTASNPISEIRSAAHFLD